MKNKAHFVKTLCSLKKIDIESEEAKELYSLSVVDLLIAIKQATPVPIKSEPEDFEERTLAQMVGFTQY